MNETGILLVVVGLTIAAMTVIASTAARIVARNARRSNRAPQRHTDNGSTWQGRQRSRPPVAAVLPLQEFDAALQRAVHQARRHGTYLSLIRVEIDPFYESDIDQRQGPSIPLLERNCQARHRKDVVDRVAAFLIASIHRTDMITHLKDDGFAILTPGSDESAALKLTDALRRGARFETLGAPTYPGTVPIGSQKTSITCCFGVASLEDQDSVATFRGRAESALRHAQRHGSNRIMGQTAAEATAVGL